MIMPKLKTHQYTAVVSSYLELYEIPTTGYLVVAQAGWTKRQKDGQTMLKLYPAMQLFTDCSTTVIILLQLALLPFFQIKKMNKHNQEQAFQNSRHTISYGFLIKVFLLTAEISQTKAKKRQIKSIQWYNSQTLCQSLKQGVNMILF